MQNETMLPVFRNHTFSNEHVVAKPLHGSHLPASSTTAYPQRGSVASEAASHCITSTKSELNDEIPSSRTANTSTKSHHTAQPTQPFTTGGPAPWTHPLQSTRSLKCSVLHDRGWSASWTCRARPCDAKSRVRTGNSVCVIEPIDDHKHQARSTEAHVAS